MPSDSAIDFRFIAENSIDIIWDNGMDHAIHYVSPSVFYLLGWKPEEMIGRVFDDFVLPEDLPILAAAATLMFSPGVQNSPSTLRMRRKDGSSVWMETNARLVREPATGEPKEYVLVMRDITERKKLEDQVSASAVDFQFLAKYSADLICRAGMDQVIEYLSPSSLELLGWTPEERIGKKVYGLIVPEDLPIFDKAYQRLLAGADTVTAAVRMRKKNGSIIWMEGNARLVRNSATAEPKGVVVIMRDITKRKKLEDQLSALALTDGLTGLLNRRAFDGALEREWKRTLRDGSEMSLLLLDIDHFKQFNDQYGHLAGDDCLRAVAAAVCEAVRTTDTVARYGGEEITVILPSTFTAGAVEVAEKIRSTVEALRLPLEGNPEGGSWVTVSVGVATALARQGGTIKMPESLLLAADNAMYKAKHEGRNRVATALLIAPKEG
jgi:diguanylate cyclase (GGDEF)-like protein/PAS domain S-box-containing protein